MRRCFTTYSVRLSNSTSRLRGASRGDPLDSHNIVARLASSCPIYIVQLCFLARVCRMHRSVTGPRAAMRQLLNRNSRLMRLPATRRFLAAPSREILLCVTHLASTLTMLFAPHLSRAVCACMTSRKNYGLLVHVVRARHAIRLAYHYFDEMQSRCLSDKLT